MADSLQLTSPAFDDGGDIPVAYTADGDNINPPLMVGGVPDEAQSLALIIDDPDAATDPHGPGKTYDHWIVFNIPPDTIRIGQDSVPPGAVVGTNSARVSEYVGPAPPTGTHRYFFRLYALRDLLPLDSHATKQDVLTALEPLVVDETELVGAYGR